MAENKRYYWLKLHEEFFTQPVMKYIRKLPDGEKITIIYLKLLLVSLRTDGYIFLEGLYPTIEEEIALNLDEELMSVQFSLAALEKVNLLERGSGEWDLCMTRLPEMVGSETGAAARMRNKRLKSVISPSLTGSDCEASHCYADVRTGYADVRSSYAENEIEKKQNTDSEPDKDEELLPDHFYGANQNVFLSDEEYLSLKRQYPDYRGKIDYLSVYMAQTGKRYKSHYLTIVQWAKKDAAKQPQTSQPVKPGFEDYSFKKGQSF